MVQEFCALLKAYGISSVRGDRYAGEWPRERFRTHGVDYVTAVKPKNDMSDPLIGAGSSGRNGCPTLHRLFEFDRL